MTAKLTPLRIIGFYGIATQTIFQYMLLLLVWRSLKDIFRLLEIFLFIKLYTNYDSCKVMDLYSRIFIKFNINFNSLPLKVSFSK